MEGMTDHLRKLVKKKKGRYRKSHSIGNYKGKTLDCFLASSMDEARLRYAEDYANHLLDLFFDPLGKYFRRAVLQREVSGDIEWRRQRDHAAHTLNNYLLGWLFYSRNTRLRRCLKRQAKARFARAIPKKPGRQWDRTFLSTWLVASLLHDIGYAFEGSLGPLQAEVQSRSVARMGKVLRDYFHCRFWQVHDLCSPADAKIACKLAEIRAPEFPALTVPRVAESMRRLPKLSRLRDACQQTLELNPKIKVPKAFRKAGGLPSDSFELWKLQDKTVGKRRMAKRIEDAAVAFDSLVWDGQPNSGVRLIDHGIAGGLIELLGETVYHCVRYGMPPSKPDRESRHVRVWKQVTDSKKADLDMNPLWWWTGIVWASSATALHNLQQQPRPWPGSTHDRGPLKLEDDALCYLGILVDILQEWDRYSLSRDHLLVGPAPLQGRDVEVNSRGRKVRIKFPNKVVRNKVEDALDLALKDWHRLVELA